MNKKDIFIKTFILLLFVSSVLLFAYLTENLLRDFVLQNDPSSQYIQLDPMTSGVNTSVRVVYSGTVSAKTEDGLSVYLFGDESTGYVGKETTLKIIGLDAEKILLAECENPCRLEGARPTFVSKGLEKELVQITFEEIVIGDTIFWESNFQFDQGSKEYKPTLEGILIKRSKSAVNE